MPKNTQSLWTSRLRAITLMMLAGLTLVSLRGSLTAAPDNRHLMNTACKQCHLSGADGNMADPGLLLREQETLCLECHPDALEASHPSGFVASRALPEAFPVNWQNALTCSTCHDIHGQPGDMLRTRTRGKAFCTQCHSDQFFAHMLDGGTSLIRSAHLGFKGNWTDADLDPYSAECMSCHAEEGNAPSVGMGNDAIVLHTSGGLNHPVGTRYQDAVSYGGYRPVSQLPETIRLPDGKVSCISCHESYSPTHGKLSVDNRGSQLCLNCHDI